jgi:hypothetical protein
MSARRPGLEPSRAAPLLLPLAPARAAPRISGRNPLAIELGARIRPPRADHPFGQDTLGRDVLARALRGTGLPAGRDRGRRAHAHDRRAPERSRIRRGLIDELFTRVVDVLLAFPACSSPRRPCSAPASATWCSRSVAPG